MTLPDFLLIGAPKAGSTTLNIALNQHPEIFMCPRKEVGFFWIHGDDSELQGPGTALMKNRVIRDTESYQKLFSGVRSEKRIGEASVRYISHPRAPKMIHHFIPETQLIAILRQPADRAFSSYLHARREGIEPCNTFAEAIDQERKGLRDNWSTLRLLRPGYYYEALTRYTKLFDISNIHISLFDDLHSNPQALIKNIYNFLGVNDAFVADLTHHHNASGIIRNPISRWFWAKSKHLRAYFRPYLNGNLKHSIYEWVIRDMEKLKIDPELRVELTELYREDIEQLQELIRRDLDHWVI